MQKVESQFYIVVEDDFPTRVTYKHLSYSDAHKEASRLARQYNKKFVVMQAIWAVEIDNVVETNYESPEEIPF
jgi:hypothetical protein